MQSDSPNSCASRRNPSSSLPFPHICSSKGSETRDNARSNMACPLSDSSCCVHTKRRGWCNSKGTLEAFLPFRTTCTSSAFMYGRLLMKPSAMKRHGHKKAGRIHVCSNRVFNRYGISSGRPILCTTGIFSSRAATPAVAISFPMFVMTTSISCFLNSL